MAHHDHSNSVSTTCRSLPSWFGAVVSLLGEGRAVTVPNCEEDAGSCMKVIKTVEIDSYALDIMSTSSVDHRNFWFTVP